MFTPELHLFVTNEAVVRMQQSKHEHSPYDAPDTSHRQACAE